MLENLSRSATSVEKNGQATFQAGTPPQSDEGSKTCSSLSLQMDVILNSTSRWCRWKGSLSFVMYTGGVILLLDWERACLQVCINATSNVRLCSCNMNPNSNPILMRSKMVDCNICACHWFEASAVKASVNRTTAMWGTSTTLFNSTVNVLQFSCWVKSKVLISTLVDHLCFET